MPIEHNTSEEDREHRHVRRALKSLPKAKAPWYFEAKLQQRLRTEKSTTAASFWRPMPAYVASAVVLFIVGVIGYTSFFIQESLDQPAQVSETPTTEPPQQPGPTPASPTVTSPSGVETHQEVTMAGPGPSAPSTSIVQESRPMDRTATSHQDENAETDVSSTQFVPTPSLQELGVQARPVGLRAGSSPAYVYDSAVVLPAARDSLDSLKALIDSLHRHP